MRVGNRIAEVRRARGWSQSDLLREMILRFPDARFDPASLSRWEHGKPMPSLASALMLAAVLGEPVEALFPFLPG